MAAFPTTIEAIYMGMSRKAGEFTTQGGEEVAYGEKFDFAFESSEGLTQNFSITGKRLIEAGIDPTKLKKLSGVRIEADVVVTQDGGYVKPFKIIPAGASAS
jgi:hypothetical protein